MNKMDSYLSEYLLKQLQVTWNASLNPDVDKQ